MNDDPTLLRRAAEYLERSRAVFSDICIDCSPDEATIHAPVSVVESDGATPFWLYA